MRMIKRIHGCCMLCVIMVCGIVCICGHAAYAAESIDKQGIDSFIRKQTQSAMQNADDMDANQNNANLYISRMSDPRSDGLSRLLKMIDNADMDGRSLIYNNLREHLLSDDNAHIRYGCASCLYKYGKSAINDLVTVLHGDRDRNVRKAAARTLGIVGGETELDELYKACVEDKGAFGAGRDVAKQAAEAIGDIGGEKASDLLVKLWREGLHDEALISSIGTAGHPKGIDALEEILKGKDPLIRKNAAYGLVEIARHNKDNAAVVNRIDKIFRKYVADKNDKVRENITSMYGVIGTMDDIPTLNKLSADEYKITVSYMENGQDKKKVVYPVREKAAEAIKNIKARHEKAKSK